jgi:hypothetical protein
VTEAHIREVLRATKGLLDEWDALNEPYTNHDIVTFSTAESWSTGFASRRRRLRASCCT